MTSPVFFLGSAATVAVGEVVGLDGPEGRHAADVRRLRSGERVTLTDGRGASVTGRVVAVRQGGLDVAVEDTVVHPPRLPRLVVAQALAKGGRDEDAVEAMTEIGVDEVIGWAASRSIARWTDRTSRRWSATIEAAAKQSRRVWWPAASGPVTTAELADRCRDAGQALILHEAATESLAELAFDSTDDVLLVVGPEGGITDDELAAFRAAGAVAVRLGVEVLRSSTAGVAALAAICADSRWRS